MEALIDVDAHIIEPPDLWSKRFPVSLADDCPKAVFDERTGTVRWLIGGYYLDSVASHCHAGWKEHYPSTPPDLESAHPAGHNAGERLKWMDRFGIRAQVIYPNLLGFFGYAFMAIADPVARLRCVQAYNDFQSEWCDADPRRLIPVAALPWWDVDECVTEMKRCSELGHRGVNWASRFEALGLPPTADTHWDPVFGTAQDLELPLSFHVGFGTHPGKMTKDTERTFADDISLVHGAVMFFLGNAECISGLITGGVCERFPRLKLVSVESGFGYIPYLLQALDWQFRNNRASARRTGFLLPSEYFRRQIYVTFWFEEGLGSQIEVCPDNVMFETDFPHPTCLFPGDGSIAADPAVTVRRNLAGLDPAVRRKVLFENAARLYRVDVDHAQGVR